MNRNLVCQLYDQGFDPIDIAEQFGYPLSDVQRLCNSHVADDIGYDYGDEL